MKYLLIFLLGFSLLFATPLLAQDLTKDLINGVSGINLPNSGQNPSSTDIDNTVNRVIGRTINAFLSIFGVLFLCLIIYGGYKWMLAQGREEEVKKGKEIIRSAIIGLGIVLLAYVITYFVLTQFLGAATGTVPQ